MKRSPVVNHSAIYLGDGLMREHDVLLIQTVQTPSIAEQLGIENGAAAKKLSADGRIPGEGGVTGGEAQEN